MGRICILGDVALDTYYYGTSTRISPEAPVPIVNLNSIEYSAGCAANAAVACKKLGGDVELISRIGSDLNGLRLTQILNQLHISNNLRIYNNYKTIEKLRIYSNDTYTLRLDTEEITDLPGNHADGVVKYLEENIKKYSVFLLSDYGKGYLSKHFIQKLVDLAHKHGIFVIADPKNEVSKYYGVDLLTPNKKELFDLSKCSDIDQGIQILLKSISNILLTKSEDGFSLYNKENVLHWKSLIENPATVTGAGDILNAGIVYFLSIGKTLVEAIELTNPIIADALSRPGTAMIK